MAYLVLSPVGGNVSSDGGSQLETLWNTAASGVYNAIDAYGWVVPAVVLTALMFVVLFAIGSALDGAGFDFPLGESVGGIFRWTRKWWRGTSRA